MDAGRTQPDRGTERSAGPRSVSGAQHLSGTPSTLLLDGGSPRLTLHQVARCRRAVGVPSRAAVAVPTRGADSEELLPYPPRRHARAAKGALVC